MPEPAPVEIWGQYAGDILHNFRRTLDAIAWDLGERFSTTPLSADLRRTVQFPLTTNRIDFDAKAADMTLWLSRLEAPYVERLGQLQPYAARDNPSQTALAWLVELDNARKHRGGLNLTEVMDTEGDADFAILRMRLGPAASGVGFARVNASSPLVDGMRVMKLTGYSGGNVDVPDGLLRTLRLTKPGKASTLDTLLSSLHAQLVSTIVAIYNGLSIPPWFTVDPNSQIGQRIQMGDGALGEWVHDGGMFLGYRRQRT